MASVFLSTRDLRRVTELGMPSKRFFSLQYTHDPPLLRLLLPSSVPTYWAAAAERVAWQTWCWMARGETLAEGLVVPQDLEHAVQEAIVLSTLVAQAPMC